MKSLLLLSIASSLILSGCASLSEGECRSGNWSQIGYADGSNGKPSNYIVEHESSCHEYGVVADRQAYQQGRRQGLQQNYCTRSKGYQLASSLYDYNKVCPIEFENDLLDGYAQGLDEQYRYGLQVLEQFSIEVRQLERLIARTRDPVTIEQLKEELHDKDHELEEASERLAKTEYLLKKHGLWGE